MMILGVDIQSLTLTPAAYATLGGLLASLAATMMLTSLIRRRESAQKAMYAQTEAIQLQRIQRATNAELPSDVQKRLRELTADLDRPLVSEPAAGVPVPAGVPAAGLPQSAAGMSDDATRLFDALGQQQAKRDRDATGLIIDHTVRFDGQGTGFMDDATRFFDGAEPMEAMDDEAIDPSDFFGGDLGPVDSKPVAAPAQPGTRFFGPEAEEVVTPQSETRFFAPNELDTVTPRQVGAVPGLASTGSLHALPPGFDDFTAAPLRPRNSGPLGAQPQATGTFDSGTLARVQACLAALDSADVVAVAVMDSAGNVMAGETDPDLTGELRSLMADAGMGSASDVDQPVRLEDNSMGAILLLPTGSNAVLGALVLDAEDPQETRARLRSLAHEIGDAMRRAS
jgi:hypothetical protein